MSSFMKFRGLEGRMLEGEWPRWIVRRGENGTHTYQSTAMPAVVVRQRKAWRRRDGVFLYFEVRVTL